MFLNFSSFIIIIIIITKVLFFISIFNRDKFLDRLYLFEFIVATYVNVSFGQLILFGNL